ncbi:MAG: glycogen synthase [Candidatus Kariarchaeaceae archaeon]|jgi:starch synthase
MRVLWITAELAPFAKVGGLADVSASLPKALHKLGTDIRLVLPYYGFIENNEIADLAISFRDYKERECKVFRTVIPGSEVPVYLVKNEIFQTGTAYGEKGEEVDLGDRFTTFCWIAVNLHNHVDFEPDLYHAHDWHTGPVMAFLKQAGVNYRSIFTIHNLAYQGNIATAYLREAGLSSTYIDPIADPGEVQTLRFLRLGILHPDLITTVSPTYAKEIMTPEYGYGLERDMTTHRLPVKGILNGIDPDEWDPQTDQFLHRQYGPDSLDDKIHNKTELQKEAGLKVDPSAYTVGIVTRLVYQKGVNILVDIIPDLMQEGFQVIILGTGDEKIEEQLRQLRTRYPDSFGIFLTYNEKLSHLMFAGLDSFVIPSRYEPCGLTQMYSMRYGTVPVVRCTGGLADTVEEDVTGFLFGNFSSQELLAALRNSKSAFDDRKNHWRGIQLAGMQSDWSWKKNALTWLEAYNEVVQTKTSD